MLNWAQTVYDVESWTDFPLPKRTDQEKAESVATTQEESKNQTEPSPEEGIEVATKVEKSTPTTENLNALLERIDPWVIEDAERYLNQWLRWIEGKQLAGGVIPSEHVHRKEDGPYYHDDLVEEGGLKVDMNHGASAREAALLFRVYEMTGDEAFLQTGLRFCDFLLKAQQRRGHWARTYIVSPSGKIEVAATYYNDRDGNPWLIAPENTCRIQDGFQDAAFSLLLYAYRLTGDTRYLEAAKRNANLLLSLQNENGSWPDEWDFTLDRGRGPQVTNRGVRVGGSYNDHATTKPLRMMALMYQITQRSEIHRTPPRPRSMDI